jgi:glycine oxidase
MLAPVTEANFGERDLIDLNLAAARFYPAFVEELESATGADVGFIACGTVAAATDRDELEQLHRLHSLQQQLGLEARMLSASEARSLEPALSRRVMGGIHAPLDHQISPRALCDALARAFTGELCVGAPVARVTASGERVTGVETTKGERIAAGQVVIAAGHASAGISGLPPVPLRPVKGQILRLRGPRLVSRVVRTPEVYAVPRADGRLVVGATVEELGEDRSVTAGGVLELLRRAYDVLPGVTELELVEASAGLRPTAPDNGPLVGPGQLEGLIWATGHWRNGILQAPVTGQSVAALLAGDEPLQQFEPFSPLRFDRHEVAV